MTRALGRARRRWLATLLTAIALTGALVGERILRVPKFDASIVVRVTEREFDAATKPPSSGELHRKIQEVFLSRSTLLALITELELYPDLMGPDPSLALEAMKDDLVVRVVQNYFDPERDVGAAVRSARVVIEYSGRSPDHALALVRRLGQRLSEQQSRRRRAAAQAATLRGEIRQAARYAQMRSLVRQHAALSRLKATSPLAAVQLRRVTEESAALQSELDGVSGENVRDELRGSLEEEDMGMQFDLVDGGQRPTPFLTRGEGIFLSGTLGFLFFLPLSTLGFGLVSNRVDDALDIVRLGLRPLGRVPWQSTTSRAKSPS